MNGDDSPGSGCGLAFKFLTTIVLYIIVVPFYISTRNVNDSRSLHLCHHLLYFVLMFCLLGVILYIIMIFDLHFSYNWASFSYTWIFLYLFWECLFKYFAYFYFIITILLWEVYTNLQYEGEGVHITSPPGDSDALKFGNHFICLLTLLLLKLCLHC